MSTHVDAATCQCRLHRAIEQRRLEARRHECYRQLARAILGPDAPREDAPLALALAEHARRVRATSSSSSSLARAA